MGIIKDNKKFDRKIEQTTPTNPEGIAKKTTLNKVDTNEKTIKKQQNKK